MVLTTKKIYPNATVFDLKFITNKTYQIWDGLPGNPSILSTKIYIPPSIITISV